MVIQTISRYLLRQPVTQSLTRVHRAVAARCMSTASHWSNFEMAPLDPIIGLNESFNADDFPQKVIVGVGAYRDDTGKPYVLPCVREAEKLLLDKQLDMEYAGIVSKKIMNFTWSHNPFLLVYIVLVSSFLLICVSTISSFLGWRAKVCRFSTQIRVR